jgi:outer membrane protein insertion porin family
MGVFANWKGLLLLGATLSLLITAAANAAEPSLRTVRFAGRFPFSESSARDLVSPSLGKPFNTKAANAAAIRLRDACRRRHYPLAKVEWRAETPSFSGLDVVFTVELGHQGRLKEVRFTGRRALSIPALLQTLSIRPRPRRWDRLLGRDYLMYEDLAKDQKSLLARYLQDGYATAEIGEPSLEWVGAIRGYRLTWPIYEGSVYTVGYIRLDAEPLPAPADLKMILALNAGDRFERKRVQAAVQRFEAYYRNRGHAFPSVQAKEEWVDASARVDLLFRAIPGTKPVLRHIQITGNTNTADRIILREIPLKPGQVFDAAVLQEAQDRLSALPMFSKVEIGYDGAYDAPGFVLNVAVKERKTGRVEVGVVYGEAEGAAFQFNVTENNLALAPPFRGDALQGKLGLTVGSEIMRGEVSMRNPRLGDSLWSLDIKAYYEDSQAISDYYDQLTYGGNVLFSHPLGRHNLISSGYAVNGYETYNLNDAQVLPSLVTNQELFVTSWILAWSMDYADRRIRPTRGVRLNSSVSLGNQALGGDVDIVETVASGSLFASPFLGQVLSLRGGVKSVDPYGETEEVAQPLRSYLGGSRDLRGFEYKSVSPLDAASRPMGGQSAWWGTLEYRLPVLRWLDLAFYYDVGDVSLESYQFAGDGPVSNWGIGVLVQAEEFPVRFDFATPIKTLEGDPNNETGKPHFSFSAGYRF